MKKKTIYTLLCTTILASGVSLGMDQKDGSSFPKTPQRVAQLKEGVPTPLTPISADSQSQIQKIVQEAPKTPQIKAQQELKYPADKYPNPERRAMFVEVSTEQLRQERDKKVTEALDKVAEEEAKKRLEKIQKAEEAIRAEREKKQEELFARSRESASQYEQDNLVLRQKLDKQVEQVRTLEQEQSSVENRVKILERELEESNELGTFTAKAIELMKSEIARQKETVLVTKEKLRKANLEKEELALKVTTAKEGERRAEEFIEKNMVTSSAAQSSLKVLGHANFLIPTESSSGASVGSTTSVGITNPVVSTPIENPQPKSGLTKSKFVANEDGEEDKTTEDKK